ncbi:hypothetical protein DNI29_23455 [Hymenobacter sediminis]|uniref:hypothetical protein n=1 Tax=Hymenobacter sediminis TaxID=2218621 RepID=UPI000DA64666|nr:hypothetical protein [Hymenobacter sediminis]RPD43601.1 hypothetical protein DNI29_23455 [Hymenobacter sediminis]
MSITQAFSEEQDKFDHHFTEINKLITHEEWTAGQYFNIGPYDFQRSGFKQGKKINKKPISTKNKYCYSFDIHNNIIVIKHGLSINNQYNYEFIYYDSSRITSLLYASNKTLINIKIRNIVDNKVQTLDLKGVRGSKHEEYFYNDNLLTRIRVDQWNNDQQGTSFNVLFSYNGEEVNKIKNIFDNGYEEVKYDIEK